MNCYSSVLLQTLHSCFADIMMAEWCNKKSRFAFVDLINLSQPNANQYDLEMIFEAYFRKVSCTCMIIIRPSTYAEIVPRFNG